MNNISRRERRRWLGMLTEKGRSRTPRGMGAQTGGSATSNPPPPTPPRRGSSCNPWGDLN
eukprot:8128648-Pyramimonas_sp.AAC.1